MYQISAPLMNDTIHSGNRDQYLSFCREAGVSRIFLAIGNQQIPSTLGDNIAFFKQNGFEVGVWFDTIGHGFVLGYIDDSRKSPYPAIVDIEGIERPFANCPFGNAFRERIARFAADVAKLGPDMIMLDDDLRLSQHGEHLCCACPMHMARISEILGETVTREQIKPFVLSGKPNKFRDAWLQAQNESMIELVKDIRAEVDKNSPHVTVCTCTAYSPWDVDGMDVPRLARILAGNHKPILRLTGAPYWATKMRKFPLIGVFEIARMLASFVCDEGFELMSEGDVYPRPRYTTPASYLELYDMATRIDGHYDGILKYMFDYGAGVDFETGYLAFHNENRPFYEALERLFPSGANAGVRIVTRPHTYRCADLDLSSPKLHSPLPQDGILLGQCGIPTIYSGKGVCNAVFGENARTLDLAELREGTILDATAAVILTERGVDVGLKFVGCMVDQTIGFLCTDNPEHKTPITDGQVRVLNAECRDDAEPVLFVTECAKNSPIAYRYENARGERFLVFLFEGASIYSRTRVALSGLNKNYVIQEALIKTILWVAQEPMPAYCDKNPELYVMCERDGDSMSVALLNAFADPVLHPTVVLDERYSQVECIGCEAVLDGNTVTLTSRVQPFSAAAFRVWR